MFLGDWDLPVLRVTVSRREELGVSQGIQTVIHPWERIRVPHRSIVELAIIDAKACGPIRSRHKNNLTGPLTSAGFNHVQLEHLGHLLADEL